LHRDGSVSVANVVSYRHAKGVAVPVEGHGVVHGDVAWGGNWFFLCEDHGQTLAAGAAAHLTAFALRVRDALERQGVTGTDGAVIDHIELVGPAADPANQSRNFVLCPGGIIGSVFSGRYTRPASLPSGLPADAVLPLIHGRAHVTLDATLVFDPDDPFAWGLG
jgi:4-hydroxyproline epimerase